MGSGDRCFGFEGAQDRAPPVSEADIRSQEIAEAAKDPRQNSLETVFDGGVVCAIIESRGRCEYAMLVREDGTESSVQSFMSSRYCGHTIPTSGGGSIPGPHVIRPEHRMLKLHGNPFLTVGNVALDPDKFLLGSWAGVVAMEGVVEEFVRIKNGRFLFPLSELLKT